MVRMLRISRLFSRWESAMEIDYRRLSLGKFAGAFLLTSHWMACLWHLTVEIERIAAGSEPLVTWVEHYPYFTGMSPAPLYIASLYWATVRARPSFLSRAVQSCDHSMLAGCMRGEEVMQRGCR